MNYQCQKCHKKYVEYPEQLCDSCRADEIENESHNADLMQDEMEEMSWEELHGIYNEEGQLEV